MAHVFLQSRSVCFLKSAMPVASYCALSKYTKRLQVSHTQLREFRYSSLIEEATRVQSIGAGGWLSFVPLCFSMTAHDACLISCVLIPEIVIQKMVAGGAKGSLRVLRLVSAPVWKTLPHSSG